MSWGRGKEGQLARSGFPRAAICPTLVARKPGIADGFLYKHEGVEPNLWQNRRERDRDAIIITERHGIRGPVVQIVNAGVLYFALVFGAGFVLGIIRTLWIVPHFGTRMAELMEAPIMFVVTLVAARWIIRRLALPSKSSSRLGMGSVALGLMLVAEFSLVLWLRGLSISEYLANRDPVSGTVYYVMLGVFAIMPLLVVRI